MTLEWPPADDGGRPELLAAMEGYYPKGNPSDDVVKWAKAIAWTSGADSRQVARLTVRALILHAQRLQAAGGTLDVATALTHDQVAETVKTVFSPMPLSIQSNLASALRRAGIAANPMGGWPLPGLPKGRRDAAPPFTRSEEIAMLRQALALKDPRRRQQVVVALALTAGAGLTYSEHANVKRQDVTVDLDVVFVALDGRNIPVRALYRGSLLEALSGLAPEEYVTAARGDSARSVVSMFAKSHGVTLWNPTRATNTWRVFQMSRVPLPVLLRGVGVSASHLQSLVSYCDEVSDLTALIDDEGEI